MNVGQFHKCFLIKNFTVCKRWDCPERYKLLKDRFYIILIGTKIWNAKRDEISHLFFILEISDFSISSFSKLLRYLVAYFLETDSQDGFIDVGDRCLRQNVLVKALGWWSRFESFRSPTSTIFIHKCRAPTFKRCHPHQYSVTNILKSSPTLSHQDHCHTDIFPPL